MENEVWWVSTKEFLPAIEERVLVLTKWGHVTDATFTNYGLDTEPTFRPDGLRPNIDVKWWMNIPADGWHNIKEEQPREGQLALTMGMYGRIYSGVWKKPSGSDKFGFSPFVWEVLFWREMPELPEGSVSGQKNGGTGKDYA